MRENKHKFLTVLREIDDFDLEESNENKIFETPNIQNHLKNIRKIIVDSHFLYGIKDFKKQMENVCAVYPDFKRINVLSYNIQGIKRFSWLGKVERIDEY